MPAFAYRAVDASGVTHRGVVEAGSPSSARRLLRERDLLPVSVEAAATPLISTAGQRFSFAHLFKPKLGSRSLATLTRQLSTLVSNDIRIEEALQLVAQQSTSEVARALLLNVRGAILNGRSFASALADHPNAFPEFYRASIASGEQSGRLGDVLSYLAEFVERRHRTHQKVQLALLYPALLAFVSVGMIILLLVYVVPDIVKVFVSRGADLPILTRLLIALSSWIQDYGWLGLVALASAAFGVRAWLSSSANQIALDRYFATARPFATFSQPLNAARFSGTLGTLLETAVPLVDALMAAAAVTPNRHIRARVIQVAARVREGATLNRAMQEADCFPTMLVAIVASGESSGRLGPAISRAAAELDRELDALVTTLVALVEPMVLLLMGGIVLLMVLAILLPIISLNNLAGL